MCSPTRIIIDEREFDGRRYAVRFFERRTARGTMRYAAELLLGPGDRIILDAGSMSDLELRLARVMPALRQSRMLAARPTAA